MRAGCLGLIVLMLLGYGTAFGRESELILEEKPRSDYIAFGWTFLVLSAATLAYGLKSAEDSDDDVATADANYLLYQSATTASDAAAYREATESSLNDARANEERANLAFMATFLFGLTAYASFFPETLPGVSIAATTNSVILQHRF